MAADTVAIFEQSNLRQVFQLARPIKVATTVQAKLMEHPVETGATITDHRVMMPVELQVSMILSPAEYRSTYAQIKDYYTRAVLLTVQTKADSHANMLISSMPHDEDPDMFDTITVAITMREVMFVTPKFSTFKVADSKQSQTVDRGQQQGKEPTETRKQSVLASIFS